MEGAMIPASNRIPPHPGRQAAPDAGGCPEAFQFESERTAFPLKTANSPKRLHCPVLFSLFSEGHDSKQIVWTRGL